MKIGLFIPCYVDALYPEVGVATYKLLKSLNLDITYPLNQTCCGQPMANAGFEKMAGKIVKLYHPRLAKGKHECLTSKKIMDVVEFLHDVVKPQSLKAKFPHVVSVHNSCHGVRELGLSSPSERNMPQFNKIIDLLRLVDGITIKEPERKDECCGFGGMFSVEEPDVSTRMGEDKIARHIATGAEYVTGPDSSCLMHMQGIAKKENKPIKFIHVVQILAAGL